MDIIKLLSLLPREINIQEYNFYKQVIQNDDHSFFLVYKLTNADEWENPFNENLRTYLFSSEAFSFEESFRYQIFLMFKFLIENRLIDINITFAKLERLELIDNFMRVAYNHENWIDEKGNYKICQLIETIITNYDTDKADVILIKD